MFHWWSQTGWILKEQNISVKQQKYTKRYRQRPVSSEKSMDVLIEFRFFSPLKENVITEFWLKIKDVLNIDYKIAEILWATLMACETPPLWLVLLTRSEKKKT